MPSHSGSFHHLRCICTTAVNPGQKGDFQYDKISLPVQFNVIIKHDNVQPISSPPKYITSQHLLWVKEWISCDKICKCPIFEFNKHNAKHCGWSCLSTYGVTLSEWPWTDISNYQKLYQAKRLDGYAPVTQIPKLTPESVEQCRYSQFYVLKLCDISIWKRS